MKERGLRLWTAGIILIVLFVIWTVLVQTVDVQGIGPMGTKVGFAAFNGWFHQLTGVHMLVYTITDWLGLVPVCICLLFGSIGFVQMIKRKSLLKVDRGLIVLGCYYLFTVFGYLLFEMIPVNYRPILIEGRLEASYPSSTTLLVLSVMPTLVFQARSRLRSKKPKMAICICTVFFSSFMVIGRLVSGVHWFTDIAGSFLLAMGLFCVYRAVVVLYCNEEK